MSSTARLQADRLQTMGSRHTHKGASTFVMIFMLIGLWITLTLIAKLGPPFIAHHSVNKVLDEMQTHMTRHNDSIDGVRSLFMYQLKDVGVYAVTLKNDDVKVTRDGAIYTISVKYDVEVPFIANVAFVIRFQEQGEVTKP